MLDAVLERESQVGRYDSSGEFTLALSEAARKLARYQANEPLFCILKLVQAAVAAGAREIHLNSGPGRFTLRGPGVNPQQFPLGELATRLVQTQLYRGDRPDAHLATGLIAHGGEFRCSLGAQSLTLGTTGHIEYSPGPVSADPYASGGKPSLEVVLTGTSRAYSADRLRERLAYAPLPVYYDGTCLNYQKVSQHTLCLPDAHPACERVSCAGSFQGKGPAGHDRDESFSLPYCPAPFCRTMRCVPLGRAVLQLLDPQQPGQVVLVKHGVTLDNAPRLKTPGALCVVSAQGLPLDLSTLRAVEGPELAATLDGMEIDVRWFYSDLLRKLDDAAPPARSETPAARSETPSAGWGMFVAVSLVLMVVVVVLLACLGGGGEMVAGAGCGCAPTPGSQPSPTAQDRLRQQLRSILAPPA